MSASLVGSEMCIRDRKRGVLGALPAPLPARLFCWGSVVGSFAGSPSGAPVSYTHLTLPTICSV
eukprot:2544990-Alexandrium_andersonii.AAC.1